MASNTGDDHRDGSVTDRIQSCDPITKVCTKYDTTTGKTLGSKVGEYKGVARCDDYRSTDRTDKFCQ
ncbi:MAG: hypothetical protein COA39_011565 [Sulfurimonas sp.]|nr:hypothetical protein [Sulfurimonas sp.]